jgi:hypothetical protein
MTRLEAFPMLRHVLLAATLLLSAAIVFSLPPIPQDPGYHHFADQRPLLGVVNFGDVVSNIAFVVIGAAGLLSLYRRRGGIDGAAGEGWPRWQYAVLFSGVVLTGFGSAYYHLAPDNERLVWDRLPMTVAFMALVSALVSERVSRRAGRLLFAPLIATGAVSVFFWAATEARGEGDLRFYALVQFGSIATVVLLLLLYPSKEPSTRYFVVAIGWYAAAKLLEQGDAALFSLGGVVSGHTLKHLAAAAGAASLVALVRSRPHR